ncbi:hypothetical protein Zm00014a_025246, partial [Zea mays]
ARRGLASNSCLPLTDTIVFIL